MPAVIACDKLLGLIHLEVMEGIHAEIREKLQRIGALDIKVRHVVRLVEQSTCFAPRALLVPPVCELMANHGKGIRADLRVTQQVYRIPDGLQSFFQACVTHLCWYFL